MAKKKNISNSTSLTDTNTFAKGLNKDIYPGLQPKSMWTHARNLANNSVDGDIGVVGNEPANLECARIPYTVIGTIHKKGDLWIIFSTDDINSEIGSFDDSKCEYKTLVNDQCLNLSRKYLITGASKENFDCSWQIYWDDGKNPSRSLNIDDIPYKQVIVSTPGADCVIYEDTTELDCEKIRLAPLIQVPCVKLSKSKDGGQLRNGSYQAYIAYIENEQRVTDYLGVSNIQSLFDHSMNSGGLEIELSDLDTEFEFYTLAILSDNQGAKDANNIGIYSTEQTSISIDYISPDLKRVDFVSLFMRSPAYERSDSMYAVNQYLIRQGPTEQFDFNYQPLANNIKASWVVAEYPSEYYHKGGNKTQFLRDEVYSFFIRWIYNTGEKSASYHIPGRAPKLAGTNEYGVPLYFSETAINAGNNAIGLEYNFQVFNTASVISQGLNIPTDDGGTIISRGEMAYWQSTERYPATQPEIWDTLCGEPIRHHRMPTEETSNTLALSSIGGDKIRILGVDFSNIERPKYNDGTYIENIVGYEILRGSREGNKSVLAKGLFRNMRKYDIPDDSNNLGVKQGLYPNYPYNDLRDDVYFHDGTGSVNNGSMSLWPIDPQPRTDGCESNFQDSKTNYPPLKGYMKNIFTFHSPDLMFRRPFLNASEVRLYGTYSGFSTGHFIKSEKHPQNKLLRNGAVLIAGILGAGYAIAQARGSKNTEVKEAIPTIEYHPIFGGFGGTNAPGFNVAALAAANVAAALSALSWAGQMTAEEITNVATFLSPGATDFAQSLSGNLTQFNKNVLPGFKGGEYNVSFDNDSDIGALPFIMKSIAGLMLQKSNTDFGAQQVIDLIYNALDPQDFAYKYNSHGFFNKHTKGLIGDRFRTKSTKSNYIGSSFHTFGTDFKINNLFRPDTVVISTEHDLPTPSTTDKSRFCIGGDGEPGASGDFGNKYIPRPEVTQIKSISSLYGALKFNLENQYGQIRGIRQVKMSNCIYSIDPSKPAAFKYSTDSIFSGDTYIGRYTEKVIMPMFSNFLLGEPDQFPFDYLQVVNLPYPRFWMNTRQFDTSEMVNEIFSFGLASTSQPLPSDLFYLDRGSNTCSVSLATLFGNKAGNTFFAMKYGYMYTHCNGILDFFTESEINLSNRNWGDKIDERIYDEYTYNNTDDLFNAEIIKADNYYDYDYSLSASRFVTNLTPAGIVQPSYYDPLVSETCFTYYPKRLIYSMQAYNEAKKDYWRSFLVNNKKDFRTKVNVIKPISKTGAIIFFPYESPKIFQGVDVLKTDSQTKITLGDGGLFAREPQNIVNSDVSNEYGSCESQRAVTNTPYGFFFISQAQGKIFQQNGNGIQPISDVGLKWWFNKYLPSSLIKQFPKLEEHTLGDNPVVGVGCQVIYDVSDSIVYFSKRDFRLKIQFEDVVTFDSDIGFITTEPINTILDEGVSNPALHDPTAPKLKSALAEKFDPDPDFDPSLDLDFDPGDVQNPDVIPVSGIVIEIGDPLYFDECSWTVSYDPKSKAWISFHDWHPELCMASVNHFLTTKTNPSSIPICPPDFSYNQLTKHCEKIIDERKLAYVEVDEVAAFIPLLCPEGYTYNSISEVCERIIKTGITCAAFSEVKKGRQIVNYGDEGTRFYESTIGKTFPLTSAYVGPTYTLTEPSGAEVLIDVTLPDPGGWPTTDLWRERLNTVGVWTTDANPAPPLGQWIGFTSCINVPTKKEYCIGIGGDNQAKIKINGELKIDLTTNNTKNYEYWYVIPIELEAGTNIIELEGYNDLAFASFGAEIYDMDAITLSTYTSAAQLNPHIVFSTKDKAATVPGVGIGINFDIGDTDAGADSSGCSCPDGYYMSNCEGTLECVQLLQLAPDLNCTCPTGYTLVYPTGNTYTGVSGTCGDADIPPPICRKVTCNCPAPPTENTETTKTGECDNVYLAGSNGDPNYINPDPVFCSYGELITTEPSLNYGSIWRHNYRCDLFSNYYGTDYPWEIELAENTGQQVTTLRSMEYQLESYVYKGDMFNGCGDDTWHDLDFNFDEVIIHNTEQVSGLLRLVLNLKEDPLNALKYPIIGAADIQILFSKVEQKYRFNQFWDITNDRGEFSNAEQQILITHCNGYIRDLNPINLNYNKVADQRKKFRHYYNKVLLRRRKSNNRKMLLKLVNSKLNLSFR